jgi:pilus assembly protein Flp/PilA
MRNLRDSVRRFLSSEEGPTAVEYAILLAFIILVLVAAVRILGARTAQAYENTSRVIPT